MATCKTCGKELNGRNPLYCNRNCMKNDPDRKFHRVAKIRKACINCGKTFEVRPCEDKKVYCSQKCSGSSLVRIDKCRDKIGDALRRRESRVCPVCGVTFEVIPSSEQRFCSRKCWGNDPDSLSANRKRGREQYHVKKTHPWYVYAKSLCSFKGEELPSLLDQAGFKLVNPVPEGPLSGEYRIKVKCKTCGLSFDRIVRYLMSVLTCPNCNHDVSLPEREIYSFLTSLDVQVEQGNKSILDKKHIDLYIPSHNLGIELNGLLWHSELRTPSRAGFYHRDKTDLAMKKGVRLVHFWDCEWANQQDIVKSMLRSMLGKIENRVYARKCVIREISWETASSFYDVNHLQGRVRATLHLGLFHSDALVSAMSFTKGLLPRVWTLARFSSLLNTIVVGGFSKLLSFFVNNQSPKEVVSFGDLRWVNRASNTYLKNGFTEDKLLGPEYHYVVDRYKRVAHRFNFRRKALARMLGDSFDPAKSEWENMRDNGFDRVWDCGLIRFVWKAS